MKRWMLLAGLGLAIVGCDNNKTQEGARADCAEGGAINACPPPAETPEGVCTYLVECAAIPERSDDDNQFDWGNCVDDISGLTEDRQALVIQCIAASTCDTLKVDGSPDQPDVSKMACIQIGDQ